MNKKVIVFGGGTGMSFLLSGLKEYPLDITAVVSVCDDGGSTGILRKEFNNAAVGDIRKVLVALSNKEGVFEKLLNYRFTSEGTLNTHTVGNILLTAQTNISGSLQKAIEDLSSVLNLKGKVLPFTNDSVTLIGKMEDDSIIEGEHYITESPKKIKEVYYNIEPDINDELIEEVKSADLILLSMGSLYTSVIPNLLSKEIRDALNDSTGKIVYCCNLFTQPGETDGFKVSDHIKVLNKYLGKRKVDYVICNNGEIDSELALKYATEEQKDPVICDMNELNKLDTKVVVDDLVYITKKNVFRHNYLKLGYLVFSLALDYSPINNKW